MEKILGIDTGTNSLGWAIVQKDENGYRLLDKGVHIFQEGVKIEKGIESSKAAERTQHRATRVRYYRIRLRKIRLLKILSDNHFCPPLTSSDLSSWRLDKKYPASELFMEWQRTDDKADKNPYTCRHKCLHEKLNLEDLSDRYILGRALYHINQRRGFLSNRKEQGGNDEGTVKTGISTLTKEMNDAGFDYLGDYFYDLYHKGEKIRNHYTARKEHYLAEFNAICDKQQIDSQLRLELEKAIFYQRPLKSQKGMVGHCVFEKKKTRCPASHPLFEEFRMLSFLNNVKIQTPNDDCLRPLTKDERDQVIPLFLRKSKINFEFEDIAKKLAPKRMYAFYKDNAHMPYLFNYPMDTSVSSCVVMAHLVDIFANSGSKQNNQDGHSWKELPEAINKAYLLSKGKSILQIINDVWHALFFYSDNDKLIDFAKTRLGLSDDEAKKFSNIPMTSEYASLSLKAIVKILPYLRQGLIYPHATFLANLSEVVPSDIWENQSLKTDLINGLIGEMKCFSPSDSCKTLEDCVKNYLKWNYRISEDSLEKLYHPSMIDAYPKVKPQGALYQLGSPQISSIRNPMAMRSLFRLRKLVNRLLEEGKIDPNTIIHIEFARELNDANKRKAIARYVKENQDEKNKARKAILELYKRNTGEEIQITDDDVVKYMLWEEQKHICLYTGKQINISDFIGTNPKFDIEHTIPRSVGGDSTMMNLTLCDSAFNRDVKGTKLPSQLLCHDEILSRIEMWKQKYEELDKKIRQLRTNGAATKETKDSIIQKRHLLKQKRDYWYGKYERFTMTGIPEGFSRRQGAGIGVISKYARLYLQSVFNQVYTVKGIATSDFRKCWGIQDAYEKKERVNHVHHCIDAIVIACIGPNEYRQLAEYYHNEENHKWFHQQMKNMPKPWPTFVEDLKKVEQEILVSHYTADNMSKQGRRRIKQNGKTVLCKGDAARGALHNDTYYGAIETDGNVKYVKRVTLSSIDEKNQNILDTIVDDTVRAIVKKAVDEKGFKDAMAGPIWMNKEKGIQIKKVRCYAKTITNPLQIRKHRDESSNNYKRPFYVANDSNYMIAIYIGETSKGKEVRDFEIINTLKAADYYKTSNNKDLVSYNIAPIESRQGYPLAYTLKIGTMVLLYEKTADEIWNSTKEQIGERLYKVKGISISNIKTNGISYQYGMITLIFHEEARQDKDLIGKKGKYVQGENHRPIIIMSHNQINALVQGYDFEMNELGEIIRLR